MTWGVGLAVATAGLSAGQAVMQVQSGQAQAKVAGAQTRLQQEEAARQARLTGLQAREAELQRQGAALASESSARAFAGAAGLDLPGSGSALALQGENERVREADLTNIRLLGASQQRALAIQGRGLGLQASAAKALGADAWARGGMTLLGGALRAGSLYNDVTPTRPEDATKKKAEG